MTEICNECGRSVAPGSGRFVNRVLDLNDIKTRKEMGKPFPEGDYICPECEPEMKEEKRQAMQGLLAHCGAHKIGRAELAEILPPEATDTHKPIAHVEIVSKLEEALAFRHISVIKEEFAVSGDGSRMFGLLKLDAEFSAGNFAIGLRNANDKSMRLGLVAGYSVFVCDNMAFTGDFKPVLAKHTKHFDLIDALSIGVDRIQRNFTSIESKVDEWQGRVIDDGFAKAIFWDAFNGKDLGLPKSLIPAVNRYYFQPAHEEFQLRTLWSLANAFTSAFKELKPVRQFQTTAKLGAFLESF